MKILLSALLWMLLCSYGRAQVFLHGVITNRENKVPLENVSVKNVSQQFSVYSNSNGEYKINAKLGDTLLFSSIGYFKFYTVVESSVSTEKNIELRKQIKLLKEAKVVGLTAYQKDSLERATLYSDQMSFEKEGSVMSPVSYVFQRISKKYKNLDKFQKTFKETEQEKYIDTKYTVKLVKEVTALTDEDAVTFMNTYPMDYEFARSATELEIKMWIKHNFKEYKK